MSYTDKSITRLRIKGSVYALGDVDHFAGVGSGVGIEGVWTGRCDELWFALRSADPDTVVQFWD